jgi:cytochrome P450
LTLSIASAVKHLADHPGLQEQLRRDPGRIPDAVEEFLRLYPPNRAFARTPSRDVEIGGRKIKKDEPIAMLWISANRDADTFAEPDEFNLDRRPNPHLSFGHGTHKCLGAPLARLEMRVALEELLARTKNIALDGAVKWADWPEYGPSALPVRLEGRDD